MKDFFLAWVVVFIYYLLLFRIKIILIFRNNIKEEKVVFLYWIFFIKFVLDVIFVLSIEVLDKYLVII